MLPGLLAVEKQIVSGAGFDNTLVDCAEDQGKRLNALYKLVNAGVNQRYLLVWSGRLAFVAVKVI